MDPGSFIPPVPPYIPPPVMPVPGVPYVPPTFVVQPGAWGANGKFVACGSCGHRFSYCMTRSVADRDPARAEERMRRMLHVERDAVPCPGCGDYQPDMLPLMRGGYRRGLLHAGVAVVLVGLVACGLALADGWWMWWSLLGLPLAGVGLITLRAHLARRLDPNDAAGAEHRKAVGKKRAAEAIPRGTQGGDFLATPDGLIDIRHMVVYPVSAA